MASVTSFSTTRIFLPRDDVLADGAGVLAAVAGIDEDGRDGKMRAEREASASAKAFSIAPRRGRGEGRPELPSAGGSMGRDLFQSKMAQGTPRAKTSLSPAFSKSP